MRDAPGRGVADRVAVRILMLQDDASAHALLGRLLEGLGESREPAPAGRLRPAAPGAPVLDLLCVRHEGDRVVLPVLSVVYARSDRGVTILTLADHAPPALRVQESLDRLESMLEPYGFFRSHRAFLVNLRRVRRIVPWSRDAQSLLLDDAKETLIPLAKSRYRALRAVMLWP